MKIEARWYAGSGEPMAAPVVLSRAVGADVVLCGEVHGHPVGLAEVAGLFDEIAARRERAALALEFFERDTQAALDDFVAGRADEAALRERTGRSEGNFPEGHQRMLRRAKAAGLPVIAANAPRRLVKLARGGYEALRALPAAEQALFRVPDELPGGRYRTAFFELMGGGAHGDPHGAAGAEGLFRAQALWDATMADSVAKALASGRRPVVLVVGAFHVEWNGGVPQMLARYAPDAKVFTLSAVERAPAAFSAEDRARADALVYVGAARP